MKKTAPSLPVKSVPEETQQPYYDSYLYIGDACWLDRRPHKGKPISKWDRVRDRGDAGIDQFNR